MQARWIGYRLALAQYPTNMTTVCRRMIGAPACKAGVGNTRHPGTKGISSLDGLIEG
jgi:hypothetical protein